MVMTSVQNSYRVRRSTRAKHVHLKVTPGDGVVVIVPPGFDERLLPGLVREQQAWIDKQLSRLGGARTDMAQPFQRPESIDLAASGDSWRVEYDSTQRTGLRVTETSDRGLRVHGTVDTADRVRAGLKRWLARRARLHLVSILDECSGRNGLAYERATIRFQRTRWGSYSSRGTISLNARLMFLRPELVGLVIAHELCHTAHLNHGPGFHALLESIVPNHRALDRELRDGWRQVPGWALDGEYR